MGQREASIPPAAKEAAEKGLHRFDAAEQRPSGAKARGDFGLRHD
jgi:hypothetical protein